MIEALCAHDTSQDWHTQDLLKHLAGCIGELAPRAHEAIQLRYMKALRPPEIARTMGWTTDAVHVVLSRARVALRECVSRRVTQEDLSHG